MPADSGPVDDGAGDDTAGGDTAPVIVVVGGLNEGTVRTCADPTRRADAPLYTPRQTGDWASQTRGTPEAPTPWGLATVDFDGDDAVDIFLPQRDGGELFLGDGGGGFALAADALPAGDGVLTNGASAADWDGDGDMDLLLLRAGPNRMLVNDGTGHFSDATAALGGAGPGYDAISGSWGDMDGDGDLDLFVATKWTAALHPEEEPDGWEGDPNLLYENDGGVLVDRSDRLVSRNASLSFCHLGGWWDVDGHDGPDLAIVNDKGDLGFTDALLENGGDGTFTDVSAGSGFDVSIQGMGLGVADLNDDQVPDFLVTDWGSLVLLVSDGAGGWYDAATARGLTLPMDDDRYVAWGAELADLDDDGDDDAPVAFGPDSIGTTEYSSDGIPTPEHQPDGLWLQGDDGTFTQSADAWGFGQRGVSRGMAVVDLNGDGWLDFVRRDMLGSARIDLQECGDEGWLEVALAGPAPNSRGVGARIEVTVGDRRWTRWIQDGSTNIATAIPPEAHFGLGDTDTIDRLTVTWPDGGVQAFTDVATRQRVVVWRE